MGGLGYSERRIRGVVDRKVLLGSEVLGSEVLGSAQEVLVELFGLYQVD